MQPFPIRSHTIARWLYRLAFCVAPDDYSTVHRVTIRRPDNWQRITRLEVVRGEFRGCSIIGPRVDDAAAEEPKP